MVELVALLAPEIELSCGLRADLGGLHSLSVRITAAPLCPERGEGGAA